MDKVNIYLYTTIKGPGAREGSYTYILEYITGKGPVTLTKQDNITATENRAHLLILIKALERLKHACELEIYTDSEYIRSGTLKWLKDWERRGWVTAKGRPVANKEEWQQASELLSRHLVTFRIGETHSYREWIVADTEKREKERRDAGKHGKKG